MKTRLLRPQGQGADCETRSAESSPSVTGDAVAPHSELRTPNSNAWITAFIAGLLAQHRSFSAEPSLTGFFDHHDLCGPGSGIYFHCASGVHRSRMILPAFPASEGMELQSARLLNKRGRPETRLSDVYLNRVSRSLEPQMPSS